MGSSQTKLVSVKLYRLLLIWPTWLAKKVRSIQNFCISILWVVGFFFSCLCFGHRDLGTPSHHSKDMQAAQLGGRV